MGCPQGVFIAPIQKICLRLLFQPWQDNVLHIGNIVLGGDKIPPVLNALDDFAPRACKGDDHQAACIAACPYHPLRQLLWLLGGVTGGFLIVWHHPRHLPDIAAGLPLGVLPLVLFAALVVGDADGIYIDFMQGLAVKPQEVGFITVGGFGRSPRPVIPDNQIPPYPVELIQYLHGELIYHLAAPPTVERSRRF